MGRWDSSDEEAQSEGEARQGKSHDRAAPFAARNHLDVEGIAEVDSNAKKESQSRDDEQGIATFDRDCVQISGTGQNSINVPGRDERSAWRHELFGNFICGSRMLSEKYEILTKISAGSYGCVWRARRKLPPREIVALKELANLPQWKDDGFMPTSLREISRLLELKGHPNIVEILDIVVSEDEKTYIVLEYIEHELRVLLQRGKPEFSLSEKKRLIMQIIDGVRHIHAYGVVHRDIKPLNLLYSNEGVVKICDFGSARETSNAQMTRNIVTKWYAAPELLTSENGDRNPYGAEVDMWSVGCVVGEILTGKPLFAKSAENLILQEIITLVGNDSKSCPPYLRKYWGSSPPVRSSWRQVFPEPCRTFDPAALTVAGLDLLKGLLDLEPSRRLSAEEAIRHRWFTEPPLPQNPRLMPTASDTNKRTLNDRAIFEDPEDDQSALGLRGGEKVNVKKYLSELAAMRGATGA